MELVPALQLVPLGGCIRAHWWAAGDYCHINTMKPVKRRHLLPQCNPVTGLWIRRAAARGGDTLHLVPSAPSFRDEMLRG